MLTEKVLAFSIYRNLMTVNYAVVTWQRKSIVPSKYRMIGIGSRYLPLVVPTYRTKECQSVVPALAYARTIMKSFEICDTHQANTNYIYILYIYTAHGLPITSKLTDIY